MNIYPKLIDVFYSVKSLIPRKVQLQLRRQIAQQKIKTYAATWPILESATQRSKQWTNWPDEKQFAVVLRHDVESKAGQEKVRQLMQIEKDLGFRSAFYFVPERYDVCSKLRAELTQQGFEVGVHGLKHDGKLYRSQHIFKQRVEKINQYIKEWGAVGFSSPSSHHILEWHYALDIEYDTSTFDTDPFQPHPTGLETIFPQWIDHALYPNEEYYNRKGYVELPYTLPQDFQLFIILRNKDINIWKKKVDWIAEHGGMVHVITHPDYICFGNDELGMEEYPIAYYEQLLHYIKQKYAGLYWHGLPNEVAAFFSEKIAIRSTPPQTELIPTAGPKVFAQI